MHKLTNAYLEDWLDAQSWTPLLWPKKKSVVARQTRILYFLIKISREFEWTIIFKIKWLIKMQNLKYSHHCKNKHIQVLFKFHGNTAYGFLLFLFKKKLFFHYYCYCVFDFALACPLSSYGDSTIRSTTTDCHSYERYSRLSSKFSSSSSFSSSCGD